MVTIKVEKWEAASLNTLSCSGQLMEGVTSPSFGPSCTCVFVLTASFIHLVLFGSTMANYVDLAGTDAKYCL